MSPERIDLLNRIEDMNERLEKARVILDQLEKVVSEYNSIKEDVRILQQYMESGQWQLDYEADEAGQIPSEVKRGVLSEDGLYNLLHDSDTILAHALKVLGDKNAE